MITKGNTTSRKSTKPQTFNAKRKSQKYLSAIKYTHLFFIIREIKQFTKFNSHMISATVSIHPDLATISTLPLLCRHNQVDFQFAFSINLSESDFSEKPEILTPKISIFSNDSDCKHKIATATISQTKSKPSFVNGQPILYLSNHQDIPLKLISSPKIGGFINVTFAFASIQHQQSIEPSIEFIETLWSKLQIENSWENEAIENSWVPPEKASEIWQKIAREHGWKSPDQTNIQLQIIKETEETKLNETADLMSFSSDDETEMNNSIESLGKKSLEQKDEFEGNVEDFVSFALASKYQIETSSVFDKKPKAHDFSKEFAIFDLKPDWQNSHDDENLENDIKTLLSTEPNNADITDYQKETS